VTPRTLPAVWVDGQPCADPSHAVAIDDRGFTLADGVFETMRVVNGAVFRLDRHLARLTRSLDILEIAPPPRIEQSIRDAVRESGAVDGGVRLTVTRGAGASGVAPPANARPTVVIAVNPLPAFPPSIYEAGLSAHVASGRRNELAPTVGLKTIAYTDAVAAWLEARRAGADEALFLDTAGHCSEATASNLFIWNGTALVTPPLTCAALPGITRATILEIAAAIGVAAEDRAFGLDELGSATEAFLTSSLRGIAPLVRIGGRSLGSGAPGAVTRRLSAEYTALVARECGLTRT